MSEDGASPRPGDGAKDDVRRARPGRRSAAERFDAVMELLAGKASLEQLARRYGVLPQTIDAWRTEAVAAMKASLQRGTAKSARELELERELGQARDALTETAMQKHLLERALKEFPSVRARLRR